MRYEFFVSLASICNCEVETGLFVVYGATFVAASWGG